MGRDGWSYDVLFLWFVEIVGTGTAGEDEV